MLTLDGLEARTVLSTLGTPPTTQPDPVVTPSLAAPGTTITPSAGLAPPGSATTPAQLARAYGLSQSASSGAGTTIAIVAAYHNATIASDLAAFSQAFHLPAANFTIVNQNGQTTGLPASSSDWALESAMDVEWAHAAAPGARIVLVEARSASSSDMMTAVQTAARLGNVVSMSWGGTEWAGEGLYDSASYFGRPNVTFVAASGDDGGASGAEWPAVSPNVVGVGGTTLWTATGQETAWSGSYSSSSGASGSTGGVSQFEAMPSYQSNYGLWAWGRATPDVASVANPSTGVAVYSQAGASGWAQVGGTSAGAPVWSGLIAAADSARATVGLAPLGTSQTLALLYGLARTAGTAAFHDIVSGANFVGYAGRGYDLVTGLGSPIASTILAAASQRAGGATTLALATTPAGGTVARRAAATGHALQPHATLGTVPGETAIALVQARAVPRGLLVVPAGPLASHPTALASHTAPATTLTTVVPAGSLPRQAVATPTGLASAAAGFVAVQAPSRPLPPEESPAEREPGSELTEPLPTAGVVVTLDPLAPVAWSVGVDAYLAELEPDLTPEVATRIAGPNLTDDGRAVAASSTAALAAALAWAAWEFRTLRVDRSQPETRRRLRWTSTVQAAFPGFGLN